MWQDPVSQRRVLMVVGMNILFSLWLISAAASVTVGGHWTVKLRFRFVLGGGEERKKEMYTCASDQGIHTSKDIKCQYNGV